ncbi:MAG TPA: hypothetical protein VJY54_07895, partial [Lachnospiraceae bacterium]|nr:hypothetical protein [Lachnospiraceae bacterium]
KKSYRFAEPFFLALEKGEGCFWSTYFSAMSYSRELCALGLRKRENYLLAYLFISYSSYCYHADNIHS